MNAITVYGYIGAPSARTTRSRRRCLPGGGRAAAHRCAERAGRSPPSSSAASGPAIDALKQLPAEANAVVIASGGSAVLRRRPAHPGLGLKVRVVPTVTSLQLAFAAVALPWDDALLVSLHGNNPAPALEALRSHPKVGLLTDGRTGLPQIVAATAGLGRSYVLSTGSARTTNKSASSARNRPARSPTSRSQVWCSSSPTTPTVPPPSGNRRSRSPGEPGRQGRSVSQPIIGQVATAATSQARAEAIDAFLGTTRRYTTSSAEGKANLGRMRDLIISHLALGATTRLIAGLLADKKTDPGVVVVDEAGRFVIPWSVDMSAARTNWPGGSRRVWVPPRCSPPRPTRWACPVWTHWAGTPPVIWPG